MGSLSTESDEVVSMSERFISSLDRSRIGSFATPLSALRAIDTLHRLTTLSCQPETTEPMYEFNKRASQNALAACEHSGIFRNDVTAEMFFWWRVHYGDAPDFEAYSSPRAKVFFNESLARLNTVYTHPEMHGYFEAGIWDIDFIERCIVDGVDSELAVSLV